MQRWNMFTSSSFSNQLPVALFLSLLSIFQEAHVFIGAENMEDVTEEKIRAELSKAQAQAPTQWARRSSRSADKEELVVSHLQYMMWPSDGDRDFNMYMVLVQPKKTV